LAVALPDPGAFLSALGQPAAAPGGPLSLRGDITYTREGLVTLRDASLTALGNALNAQMDLDLSGATPQVTAHLVAGRLDLARLAGGAGGAQGGQAAPSGWSKAPIAADALSAFNGEITLAAEAIDLGSLKLDRSRLSVALDKARAVVSLREVAAYGGAVQGQLVANNRSGLSVAGKLDITGMELNGLLRDAMEIESFTGKADLKLDFLGSGASEHQIMNSLKGTAALKVGKGTITGLDLEKLLRGKTAGGVTVFDALTGSAVIEQGVLRNDDLLLELPRLIARGEGQVGIGARDINYLFTPQLRRDDDSGLAFPVRIKGSWDNPRIRPDLDKALGIDLKAEKQALKDEAKSAVTEKIGEELGVTVDPAGSVKDAAKDAARGKLEEEVKGGLRKLLNRGE
uniref:AsmA family protein n=1 Tax=Shimia sp. TaxID=1954381 RepID=UPI003567BE42